MRIINYNIRYGDGITGERWYEYMKLWKTMLPSSTPAIANFLKAYSPDVLGLIEVDTGSIRSKNQAKFISSQLAMHSFDYIKYAERSLLRKVPVIKKQGNAILSKHNIIDQKVHLLDRGTKKAVAEVTIDAKEKIRLVQCHLALGKRARAKQLNQLIDIIGDQPSTVVFGDFNTFGGESELADLIKETNLFNTHHLDREKLTQPSKNPTRIMDYILTSKNLRVKDYRVLNCHFSDHLPVLVDIGF